MQQSTFANFAARHAKDKNPQENLLIVMAPSQISFEPVALTSPPFPYNIDADTPLR
jgi:hypothetical protein